MFKTEDVPLVIRNFCRKYTNTNIMRLCRGKTYPNISNKCYVKVNLIRIIK